MPHTDAEAWTRGMGFAEAAPWHPWRYKNNTQVAGYAIVRHSHVEPNAYPYPYSCVPDQVTR